MAVCASLEAEYHEQLPRELANVKTHDSLFARGYAVGYFIAKTEARQSFRRWVIAGQLPTLQTLLAGTGATVAVRRRKVSRYQVEFADVKVVFP